MKYLVYRDDENSPILVAAFMWKYDAHEYIMHQAKLGISCYMAEGLVAVV